ncbi:chromate efflux transporter [Planctobacterium marinum]
MLFSVFKQFLLLGCISFGGPAAHLGYFKKRFVDELNWLSNDDYAQIVALSQFLPGPGSSQTGFAIGYRMAGLAGGIAAFVAFTLPSVIIILLLASFGTGLNDTPVYQGIVQGLKLLAVVVVADATLGMFNSFCNNKITQTLFAVTAVSCILLPSLMLQMLLLLICALVGLIRLKTSAAPQNKPTSAVKPNSLALLLFGLMLLGLPFAAHIAPELAMANTFFHAGSLVFGGGHVVLPMLQSMLSDTISNDVFLSGYAAAQAIPGPMFTFATWLGYHWLPATPLLGASIATLMIFLPGFLLLIGFLKSWQSLSDNPKLQGAMLGINACVTGLLLSALYQPVFISAVSGAMEMVLVIVGLWLLKSIKAPVMWLVGFYVLAGATLLV